ncbi:permease [Alicyclobacillus tolerans]|uniref:permease n=1 Tax=Alicyclobacillus tolerans TaxID=90970 RepID=UPI001F1B92DC|nr:permease [Alicyclobacillus tolerans]MCF8566667.1 permease [Alicyclobacillus tolerans]
MSELGSTVAAQNLSRPPHRRRIASFLVFMVILIAGEFYVKWDPYFHKAFVAAAHHSLGSSIVSGKANVPPTVGIQAAWSYALAYFNSVWQAVVFAIVVGAAVQALVPRDWIIRLFAKRSLGSVATASLTAVPGMMCTCCAAPITVGLRKQQASVGASLAFWLGNPVLNPATLIFIGFVLGWRFVVLRMVFGLVLVVGAGYFGNRFADVFLRRPPSSIATGDHADGRSAAPLPNLLESVQSKSPQSSRQRESASVWIRFFHNLGNMVMTVVPAYVVLVLLVGGLRAWLFPAVSVHATGLLWVIGLALAGTVFVIPTAGEVPIIQTLTHYGLGLGPAAALLLTLPAISAPSMAIVWRHFPKKALWFTAAYTFVIGIAGGVLAMLAL